MTTEVTVVIGAGSLATALTGAGYRTRTAKVDVSSQDSVR
jgi:hypothetical protein